MNGTSQENVPGMDENNQAESASRLNPCRDIPEPVQLVHETDPPAHTRPMELIICPGTFGGHYACPAGPVGIGTPSSSGWPNLNPCTAPAVMRWPQHRSLEARPSIHHHEAKAARVRKLPLLFQHRPGSSPPRFRPLDDMISNTRSSSVSSWPQQKIFLESLTATGTLHHQPTGVGNRLRSSRMSPFLIAMAPR